MKINTITEEKHAITWIQNMHVTFQNDDDSLTPC